MCTDKLGMCTPNSTSSEACLACKAGLAQMAGSFESQRDYYRDHSSSECLRFGVVVGLVGLQNAGQECCWSNVHLPLCSAASTAPQSTPL